MTLDTENHRAVLLHAVGKSAWPGEFAAEVAALLDAIKNATVGSSESIAAPPDDGKRGEAMGAAQVQQ